MTAFHCCHPIECIIPPHMADAIRMRGTAAQRKMIQDMQVQADSFRAARLAAEVAPVIARAVPVGARRGPKREVYDAQNSNNLPGQLVRSEGDPPTSDPTVNEAYDGAGATYRLYERIFRRDSLDGNGLPLVSSVHVGSGYNNAFWNGSQMAYGDGDGTLFQKFTEISVVGHELSHGVVQYSGGLTYQNESGALNESFADVFGALVTQHRNRQRPYRASWLIGEGILTPGIKGVALRSMEAPGTAYDDPLLGVDPQPFHMDDYVVTSSDNGGVHLNSGIPNHAFYLLANYLRVPAWQKAGMIWYETMQQINDPYCTFNRWADKTVEVARSLYGTGSREAMFTRRAWKLVGIHT